MIACRICRQDYTPAPIGLGGVCDHCAESAVRTVEFLFGRASIALPHHWFHVSPFEMGPGTLLRPGVARNPANAGFYGSGFGQDTGALLDMHTRRDEVVWLSPTREDARYWAIVLRASHCYEVQPTTEPRPWNGTGTDGWVVPKAIVLRKLDTTRCNTEKEDLRWQ